MGNLLKLFKDPELPLDYFRIQTPVLRYLGIELYKNESALYKCFSVTLLFNTIVIYLGLEIYEFVHLLQTEKFSEPTIEVANFALTHSMCAIESLLLYINRKKIGKMMIALHKNPFAPDLFRGGNDEVQWIRNTITISEIAYVVLAIVLMLTIMSTFLECLFLCLTTAREDWELPFAPISLINHRNKWPYFEMLMAYQLFEITVFAYATLTSYLLMSAIMAQIGVQLKIVSNSLRRLKFRAEEQSGNMCNNPLVVNKNMDDLMRNSINHHLRVLYLAEEMETLCSLMILSVFAFSVVLMCFLLFFASLYPIGSVEFYHFLFYWVGIACQVASYCYWGNMLSDEAGNVAQAAAEIDWTSSSKKLKNAMQMIMIRAQKPLYITAGKFVPLSMETFMMIIKGSFSYYAVLKHMQEEGIDENV